MPNISSYSGVDMASISKISGLDAPAGGREVDTGTYFFGDVGGSFIDGLLNIDTTIGGQMFMKTSTTSHTFTKVVGNYYWNFWGLKSDGTMWMLNSSSAYNSYGTQTSWTQLGTDTDWEDLAGGRFHFGAIKGGAYYHLGYNSYGQGGAGNTTSVTSWTQVGTDTDWSEIAHGEYFTVLVKDNGTVYTAGRNYQYRTGQGTSSGNTTSLTQISGVTNAIRPAAGVDTGAVLVEATKGDGFGTPYVWGYNNGNNLGVSGQKTSPTASTISGTGTISDMTHIALSRYTSHVIDRSGYIYRAGYSTNNVQWSESGTKSAGFDRDGSSTAFTNVTGGSARSSHAQLFTNNGKHYPSGFIGISITEGEKYLSGSSRTAIEDMEVFSGKTIDSITHVQGYQSVAIVVSVS